MGKPGKPDIIRSLNLTMDSPNPNYKTNPSDKPTMKISNSAVSGRSVPSYDEFVELEYLRFLRDMGKHSTWIQAQDGTPELKVYIMELASWDNWDPNASRLEAARQQKEWRSTATFHSFAQLPSELRADIWDYAMAPHLEAKVHCLRERNGKWISSQPTNSYLRVCHESRSICLQQPVVIAFQTYFNPEIDIAYIPDLEDEASDTSSNARAVADEEEAVGGQDAEMVDEAPGVEETEIASVVSEVGDLDIEAGPDEHPGQGDADGDDDNSFRRFIYSEDAKYIQTLALRKNLICEIPLEGHMSQTHFEMREAMPNWKQAVVVFEDPLRRDQSLDEAFQNLDLCFRDLSVKEKKRRAERSYARAHLKTINRMMGHWDIEPMNYRWVVPDVVMGRKKWVCRSNDYIPGGN